MTFHSSPSLLQLVRPLLVSALVFGGAAAASAQDRTPPAAPPAKPATPESKPTTPPSSPELGNRPSKPAEKPAEKPTDKPKEGGDAKTEKPTGPALEYVQMSTSMGTVVIELNREKAPISVENFLSYVDKGFYTGTIFHRVIPTFVIQGGGFTADMTQKATEKPIKNEWQNGLKNVRGSLSMARTPEPDSATTQFFINVADNTDGSMNNLDQPRGGAAYAVFGRVFSGMDVVDQIKDVPTGSVTATTPQGKAPMSNVPKTPVVIVKMTRITAEEAKKTIK